MKSKGERERCIQLNVELQRIAGRDKKPFFNEQCIKLEENNRRGKTRDLFTKIGNIKGTFHPKMSTIKDSNGRDLVNSEEMERTHRRIVQKKILMNQITMMVCGLSPRAILHCEVKLALGSTAVNKASGCNGIPVELLKTLKDDAVKVLHSICQQIWKTQQWSQDWKRSILIQVPKKGHTKECSNH